MTLFRAKESHVPVIDAEEFCNPVYCDIVIEGPKPHGGLECDVQYQEVINPLVVEYSSVHINPLVAEKDSQKPASTKNSILDQMAAMRKVHRSSINQSETMIAKLRAVRRWNIIKEFVTTKAYVEYT